MTSILPNPDQVNQEWKIWNQAPNAAAIAAGIKDIPAHWSLTPLQDKASKRDGWENEPFIPHAQIADLILNGEEKISKKNGLPYRAYYSGFGLRAGDYSDGLLAIDVDGAQAEELLQLVSGGDLPLTVSWTSGKPGRRQLLYQIPEQYREQLKPLTHKAIREWGSFKSDCDLDFRYNKVSSVLPPSRHPETGSYKWINSPVNVPVAIAPDWLCHLVVKLANPEPTVEPPKQQQQFTPYENITIPVAASIPLEFCLARSSRELLNGVSEGGRNEAAAKLARDLIGTANYLHSINQAFDGDPQLLLDEFAQCCHPPLPQKEVESVWKSANSKNPTPASKGEGVENCVRGWYWNNFVKRDRASTNYQINGSVALKPQPQTNILTHPTAQRLSEEELETELKKLIEDDPKTSEVRRRLNFLANRIERRDLHAIKEQYRALKQEHQADTEKPQQAETLKEIARLRTNTLNPKDYLIGDNGKLARQLMETAAAMPTRASWLFTTLIAASASCIKADSKIMISPKSGYQQSAIFRTLIIANTGAKKTPAQSAILDPLFKMELEEAHKFNQSKVKYEEELRQYERKPKKDRVDEPPPKPPIRKRFILGDATPEAIADLHGQNPNGFLVYRDEGSGFYTSLNKYRSGKGDDCELDLSEFNGKPLIVDRKSGSTCIANPHVCRTGSTQTATFKKLMGNFDDAAGYWARWLIDISPAPPSFIDLNNDTETGLSESLTQLYQAIATQESNIYGLAMPAKTLWQEYQHDLTRQLLETNLTGLQNVYPKLETYFGRFCLWLHLINAALAGVKPEPQISADTVKLAIELTNYYTQQWILFHNTQNPEIANLTEPMLAIHEFAKRKNKPVAPRDLKMGVRSLKSFSGAQLREWCEILGKTAGYGYWDGKAYAHIPNVDNVDVLLTVCQHTQNHTGHGVNGFVDNVDKNFTTSKNPTIVETGIISKNEICTLERQQRQQNAQTYIEQGVDGVDTTSTNRQHCQHFALDNQTAPKGQRNPEERTGSENLTPQVLTDVAKIVDDVDDVDDALNETELDIIGFIEEASAQRDTEYAIAIQKTIRDVCNSGAADWEKIWLRLDTQKQAAFTALLNSQS